MDLKDKIIVLTGASDGIGREIALRLAKENAKLALIARNEDRLNKVCEEAKKLGASEVKVYVCDLRQGEDLKSTVSSILTDFKTVDVLINNAGVWQKMAPLEDIPEKAIDEVIETNLSAVIKLTRLVLPELRKRDEAAILNIVSKSGVAAQEGQSVYTASKYGVRGFTEVLKAELKDSKIRVAGIYQSGTNTKMFEKTGETVPAEKFTEPSDLAEVIAFMLTRPKKIWLHDVGVEY